MEDAKQLLDRRDFMGLAAAMAAVGVGAALPVATAAAAQGPSTELAMQKLIDRGVRVIACDMAIHFYTGLLAKQMGMKHEDVKADWNSAVLPSVAHAPSGLVACQGAVSRGCTYLFAG